MIAEQPFATPIQGGALHGHRSCETGVPALLLHGGAAVPDYTDGLAGELAGLFSTVRYTQRGTPPSGGDPPYTIETHVADAIAVLDYFELDRVWVVGHSWGGHLALHLLVDHPDRFAGCVCVDPLGASPETFGGLDANLRRGLSPATVERLDEIEARRRTGHVTEADLIERFAIVWPQFFADATAAPPGPARVGVRASVETNASLADHFERRTLVERLPSVSAPVLFVHGALDPMPVASSSATAALIPGAVVETIPGCGHFPWLERPGAIRDAVERLLG